jgi:hypothetical protein
MKLGRYLISKLRGENEEFAWWEMRDDLSVFEAGDRIKPDTAH